MMKLILALLVAAASAFNAPASLVSTSASRVAVVNMNSVMGDPKLKGYRVGDRAPDGAIRSGTTKGEQKMWNLDNVKNLFKPKEEKKTVAGKKSTKSRVKRI